MFTGISGSCTVRNAAMMASIRSLAPSSSGACASAAGVAKSATTRSSRYVMSCRLCDGISPHNTMCKPDAIGEGGSAGALGEGRDHGPSDGAGGIQFPQRVEHLAGRLRIVPPQLDEGERLQGVEREAAGAVGEHGLRPPLPPVERPSGLAGGFPQAVLRGGLRFIEMALIGVDLVKTKIDRKLFRGGRERLPEERLGARPVMPIGGDALLQQRVDGVRQFS